MVWAEPPSSDLDQGIDLNGSQYLDLSANVKQLSALDSGSISFWLKASGNSDMTILSGSFADINNSFYRLFLRDNGTIRQEAMAEGQELCKVTSDASVNLGDNKWHPRRGRNQGKRFLTILTGNR